jgi:hypothetical protein
MTAVVCKAGQTLSRFSTCNHHHRANSALLMHLILLALCIPVGALTPNPSHLAFPRQLGLFDAVNESEFNPLDDTQISSSYSSQSQLIQYPSTSLVEASAFLISTLPTHTGSLPPIQPSAITTAHLSTHLHPTRTVSVDASPTLLVESEREKGSSSLSSQTKYAIIGSVVGAIVLIALIRALCAFKLGKRNKDNEWEAERISGVFNKRIITQRASMFGQHV